MKKSLLKLVFILTIIITLSGCKISTEKDKIAQKALEYFSTKYEIDVNEIVITKNELYPKELVCYDTCGQNRLYITYQDKEYIIEYQEQEDYFGDNYDYELIYTDLVKYLEKKFSYLDVLEVEQLEDDVLVSKDKYDGNIKKYMSNLKELINSSKYEQKYTSLKLWIKSSSKSNARSIHEKYSDLVIEELEELGVSYSLSISNNKETHETNSYYFYHVYDEFFQLYDNVSNENKLCLKEQYYVWKCDVY